MPDKPTALVVDDDNEWLLILEEILQPDFQVRKARTLKDVNKILENKQLQLKIALVDIRLNGENKKDKSGLDVIYNLRKARVPCIATTSYDNGDVVRAALLIGHANDVWFKSEKTVVLKEKIDYMNRRLKEDRKDAIETINFNKEFWKLILFIPLGILAVLGILAERLQENYALVIGSAVGLIIVVYGFLALFYNKITGSQLVELLKNISNRS